MEGEEQSDSNVLQDIMNEEQLFEADELTESIAQMADDTKRRRLIIEKDFEDVKLRIRNNRKVLQEVQSQIDKVKEQLNHMKELSKKSEEFTYEKIDEMEGNFKDTESAVKEVQMGIASFEKDLTVALSSLSDENI